MYFASSRVLGQLHRTPGAVRFASLVSAPDIFWSISLWEERQPMIDFIGAGEHESFLWRISTWFDSFWLMRWSPTDDQFGDWNGVSIVSSIGRRESAGDAVSTDEAFRDIPDLAQAARQGAPTFDDAPVSQRSRRRVRGWSAVTIRVEAPLMTWRVVSRLMREVFEDGQTWGQSIAGVGQGAFFGLGLTRSAESWKFVNDSDALRSLSSTWPTWAMRWDAESEFGRWDDFRARGSRR